MVSTPAFEIDRFTGNIDRNAWLRVIQDPEHPLLNRTIQSQYAPGSVFKIVVAAAGLQEGTITPVDRTNCAGDFHLGEWTFKDWKKERPRQRRPARRDRASPATSTSTRRG